MGKIGTGIALAAAGAAALAGYVLWNNRGSIAQSLTAGITNRFVNPLDSWIDNLLSVFEGNGNSAESSNGSRYVAPNPPPNPRDTNPSYPNYERNPNPPVIPPPGSSGRSFSESEWQAYNDMEIRRRQNQAQQQTPVPKIIGHHRPFYYGDKPGFAKFRDQGDWKIFAARPGINRGQTSQDILDWINRQRLEAAPDYDYFRVIASRIDKTRRRYYFQVQ